MAWETSLPKAAALILPGALDQGMFMAAIGDALADGVPRRDFATPDFKRASSR